jgi:3-oxoacyl-[acyl-carrier-protein] synthase II
VRRVVVTGIGMVTPIGSDKEEFWQSLVNGRSGIQRVTGFDVSNYPCQIAGEVPDFDPARYIEKREARKMDRFTQFGAAAP